MKKGLGFLGIWILSLVLLPVTLPIFFWLLITGQLTGDFQE